MRSGFLHDSPVWWWAATLWVGVGLVVGVVLDDPLFLGVFVVPDVLHLLCRESVGTMVTIAVEFLALPGFPLRLGRRVIVGDVVQGTGRGVVDANEAERPRPLGYESKRRRCLSTTLMYPFDEVWLVRRETPDLPKERKDRSRRRGVRKNGRFCRQTRQREHFSAYLCGILH